MQLSRTMFCREEGVCLVRVFSETVPLIKFNGGNTVEEIGGSW